MLCSISQAGFASEHWNALKTNFQHIPSQLENTFSKCRWRGSHICAAAAGLLGRMPTLLYKDQIHCVKSIHCTLHMLHTQIPLSWAFVCSKARQLPVTANGFQTLGGQGVLAQKSLTSAKHLSILRQPVMQALLSPFCRC